MASTKEQYLNKTTFFFHLMNYQADLMLDSKAKADDLLGSCLLLLTERIANKHCYRGYPHLDEMIGIALINSLAALKKFNPITSENPFGYFTRTIQRSFHRKIRNEKNFLVKNFKHSLREIEKMELQDPYSNYSPHKKALDEKIQKYS